MAEKSVREERVALRIEICNHQGSIYTVPSESLRLSLPHLTDTSKQKYTHYLTDMSFPSSVFRRTILLTATFLSGLLSKWKPQELTVVFSPPSVAVVVAFLASSGPAR